jgi:hypothetical protein
MPDYSKTIIYKIECIDPEIDDIYVGHTTNFKQRMISHKCSVNNSNRKDYNSNTYRFIRDNGGWDNWCMREVIELECTDRKEALDAEREYIELLGATLNRDTPGRTDKEGYIIYRQENPEKVKEWARNDYMKHREDRQAKQREYYLKNKEQLNERSRTKRAEKKCIGSI